MTRRELSTVYAPPRGRGDWRLEDLLGAGGLTYHGFGRHALAEALRLCAAKDQVVLLPEFICRDVLSSLAAAGARAAFYPVDAKLAPAVPPDRWPRARAVVAVDYFGFPQDLAPFREYCRASGAVLIEDNAHGLFSRDAEGRWLGARGDFGIFSLRKTLPLPNGAALWIREPGRWPAARQPPFGPRDSARYVGRQAYRAFAQAAGPLAAYGGLRWLRGLRATLTGHRIPAGDPGSETVLPEPQLPCGQLAAPLRAADPAAETRRRRLLYEMVQAQLRKADVAPLFDKLPDGAVPYGFPFRLSARLRAAAFAALAEWGLEPLPWPDLPSAVAGAAPDHYRDVHLAHFLW